MRRLSEMECSAIVARVATLCGESGLARERSTVRPLTFGPMLLTRDLGGEWFEPGICINSESVVVERGVRIDGFVKIEGGLGVCIGEHTHVSSFCHLNGGGGALWIGRHVGIASGVKIIGGAQCDDVPSMSAASPAPLSKPRRSFCFIDDQAFLGTNAVVISGNKVGRGAIVSAGSVVTHDVDPWAIVRGVPARVVGRREPMEVPSA